MREWGIRIRRLFAVLERDFDRMLMPDLFRRDFVACHIPHAVIDLVQPVVSAMNAQCTYADLKREILCLFPEEDPGGELSLDFFKLSSVEWEW